MNFPKYNCSMNITHNEHKLYYQSIENYIQDNLLDLFKLSDEIQF